MLTDFLSPPTRNLRGRSDENIFFPSIRIMFLHFVNLFKALCIESIVACKILNLSISKLLAKPIENEEFWVIKLLRTFLLFSFNFFESSISFNKS